MSVTDERGSTETVDQTSSAPADPDGDDDQTSPLPEDLKGGADGTALTCDECFELLSNPRRRYVLYCLQNADEEASLGELAERIAAWENEVDVDEVSYRERKRVYTSLQQVHLPRLDDDDVVDFDDQSGVVTAETAFEELTEYLERGQAGDVSWGLVYFGVGVLTAAALAASAVGVPLLARMSAMAWSVVAVTIFLVVSLVHMSVAETGILAGR